MLFRCARAVSFLGVAAFAAPSLGFASDSFTQLPKIFGTQDSMERLTQAYQMVQKSPLIQSLLRDQKTHALSISSRVEGHGVETTKFQHYYKGVEVMGSMSFHHLSPAGAQVRNVVSRFDLDVNPRISAESAAAIAKTLVADRALAQAPELKILPAKGGDSARLVYAVEFANEGLAPGADVMIDAHTGKVIAHISKMETLADVHVVSAKAQGVKVMPVARPNPATGQWQIVGCQVSDMAKAGSEKMVDVESCKKVLRGQTPLTDNQCQLVLMNGPESGDPLAIEPSSCAHVVQAGVVTPKADESAKRAAANSTLTLKYYKEVHGRDSFDNQGTEVVSVVHAGIGFANAAWVSGLDYMIYGDGDGQVLADMTKGVDVAGHEMTHGVVSKTAKLGKMDESGALNEAYADFFGKMIAQDGSWVVGASLSLDPSKFPGIRDMANPGSMKEKMRDGKGEVAERPYPSKVAEQIKRLPETVCDESNDRCWVHFNSTVPSHAAYLVLQAIGKEKAEALYYLTLTQYLNSEADFRKSAEATMAACAAKFDAATCDEVKAVFTHVGML